MKGSVTVAVEAPVGDVWAVVSDITRIGEFSPETFEAEWLDGARGPAVGHRFRGHVKRNQKGPTYWSQCEVTVCDVDEVFEFVVSLRGKPVNRWRYTLEPDGAATNVTESFRLESTLANRMYWTLLGRWRGPTNLDGMRTTLNRIKQIVEAGPSDPKERNGLCEIFVTGETVRQSYANPR